MATVTSSAGTNPIATVEARITAAKKALSDATSAYSASRAAILADLTAHAGLHQTAADAHTAEVKAANDLAGTIGEVAAVIDTSPQIVLTAVTGWYAKAKAWLSANWHWLVAVPGGIGATYLIAARHVFGL